MTCRYQVMKIALVSGARPNYMKIAPIIREIRRLDQQHGLRIEFILVHTGQHYDRQLFEVFFQELELPQPHHNLSVGSSSHAVQTAEVMMRFETILEQERPNLVIVVGDVNSTLAAALTAVKLGIPVAHIEAGLRSFDRTMPEEINRVVTDAISDYLFTTEPSANENLHREGVTAGKIFFVGNVMIDSLLFYRKKAKALPLLLELELTPKAYALLTLHRPHNVDRPEVLRGILRALQRVAKEIPIIFPCHPRTAARLQEIGPEFPLNPTLRVGSPPMSGCINTLEPLSYLEFLGLMDQSALVLTDSGGIQEETTILGVPCLTLRSNTERPITIEMGTNILVGSDPDRIEAEALRALSCNSKPVKTPPLWDGKAAERIVHVFLRLAETRTYCHG
jgi:UDP-N-acetylglucosamine 2-epimerase (non-hydrolysing)